MTAIIPAYNAERTIDATLSSVRAQRHRELEIIVIDDGSTDTTRAIVERHARLDARIRVVSQPNSGVAAARNRGVAESRAEYVAPVDADDLWHPDKIGRQLEAIDREPEVALVCTAYSVIDDQGYVTMEYGGALPRSDQFLDLCRRNFIGNGSSALLRRSAVEGCGGYDESLRAQGAQGCEDLKLYLCVAEKHPIKLLREPLTGYRVTPDNMSSNAAQMIRSFDIVAAEFCRRRPNLRGSFDAHRAFMICWLAHRKALAGQWGEAWELIRQLIANPDLGLLQAITGAMARRVKLLPSILSLRADEPKRPFVQATSDEYHAEDVFLGVHRESR